METKIGVKKGACTSSKRWLTEIFFFLFFYILMTFIIVKTRLLLPGTFYHPLLFSFFFLPFFSNCPVATFWLRIDILGISNYPHGKDHEAKARTTANGRQHPA